MLLIACIVALSSCQRGLYIADKVHSPGLKEAGEIKTDLSVKPQNNSNGASPFSLSADVAYAPIDHLGVFGSFRQVNNMVFTENLGFPYTAAPRFFKLDGNRFDLALGYFYRTGPKGKFEFYTGYGRGSIQNNGYYLSNEYAPCGSGLLSSHGPLINSTKIDEQYNGKYNRLFFQTGVGFDNNIVALMGGFRVSQQKYSSFSASPSLRHGLIPAPNDSLHVTDRPFTFIEPYIELQVGYKYAKLNAQVGLATQTSGPNLQYSIGVPYVSVGVVLHYAPGFRKKN